MKIKDAKKLVKPYRIREGRKFRLKDVDPEDTRGFKSEEKRKFANGCSRALKD